MSAFRPRVHTHEALVAELTQINNQIPEALLAGSIGRSVVYGLLVGDPMSEYDFRGQEPLQRAQGGPADIDLLNAIGQDLGNFGPYPLDTRAFDQPRVRISRQAGSWVLSSSFHSFQKPLATEVFIPVRGQTACGVEANALPPQTQLALLGITGLTRKQDYLAIKLLGETMGKSNLASLPGEMFEPFYELSKLNHELRETTLRRFYRGIIPKCIRRPLQPITQKVKDRLTAGL